MRLRSLTPFVLVLVLVALALPASASGQSRNRLVVGFDRSLTEAQREAIARRAGGVIKFRLRAIRALALDPRRGVRLALLRRALQRDRRVRYVERDFELRPDDVPDDTFYGEQYAFSQPEDHDIDAPEAWETQRSCGKVAVLDSGADTDHPDLKANLWKNSEEIPNNGVDEDRNGYVDDYNGVDLLDKRGSGIDQNGHGTAVAGIIGAIGDNNSGVTGVCWKATIIPVKFMDAKGAGSTSAAAAGIEYAVNRGARVINCSFGTSSKSQAMQDSIRYAKSKNTLLVVSAGNDGDDIDTVAHYPSNYTDDNVLTVAASTATDRLASFSNFGDVNADLAAPGEGILTTYTNDGYRSLSGTSVAAPYVTGAAALLKKRNGDATYAQIRDALRKKVDKPSALKNKVVYDGRLNLKKALDAIK